ncbi:MAG: hypothetical protein U0694_05500 [Anaerolineae bacterium]
MTRLVGCLFVFVVLSSALGILLSLATAGVLDTSQGIIGYAHYPVGRLFGSLYLLDLARGIRVRIASGIPNFAPLAWSPDGRKLAFADTDGADYEIYLLDLTNNRPDGRRATPLTNNNDQDVFPAFSPNSHQVVYQAYRNGRYDLYAVDIDEGHETQLTNHDNYEYAPAWSPDGQYIAFASIPDARGYGLYVLNLATLSVNYLADLPGRSMVVWSPDGLHLAFSPTDRAGVYRVELALVYPIQLNHDLRPRQDGGRVAWSPDGTRLVVASDHEGFSALYVLSADGSSLQRILVDDGFLASPAWFP